MGIGSIIYYINGGIIILEITFRTEHIILEKNKKYNYGHWLEIGNYIEDTLNKIEQSNISRKNVIIEIKEI